jgi:cell division protein FtsX
VESNKNIDNLEKRRQQLPGGDYFTELKTSVLDRTKPARIVPFYRNRRILAVAAAAVIVFTLPFILKNGQQTPPDWNSVSRDELFAYVSENIEEFETDDIAAQLAELPEINNDIELNPEKAQASDKNEKIDELFDSLGQEDILEYLEEEVPEIDEESITGY